MTIGHTWGLIEIALLCITVMALFAPFSLYLEHADIVHSDLVALSQPGVSDRRKRLRRLRLRLTLCLISLLCACAQGALAVYLGVTLVRDQQTSGLHFVLIATIVTGAMCVLENLFFAIQAGYASAARLRDLQRPQLPA